MKKNEMFDIPDVIRYIAGFQKKPDEFGEFPIAIEYDFYRPIPLSFLQELYEINPNDTDLGLRYLIDCYVIDEKKSHSLTALFKR